jgi:exosortase O
LRRFVPVEGQEETVGTLSGEALAKRPRWLLPALMMAILFLAALYSPRPEIAAAQAQAEMKFPANLSVEPWSFSPGELAWLSADGPLSASRWRFIWGEESATPRRGSVLMISSDTWRAHHRPERCFEAYGLTVDQSFSVLLGAGFPLRVLYLSAAQERYHYSAAYWLQAPGRVTDDYATRIWSDLTPNRQTWVLVTVLFDTPVDPTRDDLEGLYEALRQTVAQSLEGGNHP